MAVSCRLLGRRQGWEHSGDRTQIILGGLREKNCPGSIRHSRAAVQGEDTIVNLSRQAAEP